MPNKNEFLQEAIDKAFDYWINDEVEYERWLNEAYSTYNILTRMALYGYEVTCRKIDREWIEYCQDKVNSMDKAYLIEQFCE